MPEISGLEVDTTGMSITWPSPWHNFATSTSIYSAWLNAGMIGKSSGLAAWIWVCTFLHSICKFWAMASMVIFSLGREATKLDRNLAGITTLPFLTILVSTQSLMAVSRSVDVNTKKLSSVSISTLFNTGKDKFFPTIFSTIDNPARMFSLRISTFMVVIVS